MNAASIPTQKFWGLDYRVWLSALGSWLLCLGVFGYRSLNQKSLGSAGCGTAAIGVDGKQGANLICDLNRLVLFQLQTPAGATVKWDFGDGTAAYRDKNTAQHSFAEEGIYTVTATVNGRCRYRSTLTVKAPVYILPAKPEAKIFADSLSAMEGSRLRFSGVSNGKGKSFVWTLKPTGEVQTGKNVVFFFPRGGDYTVELVVDGEAFAVAAVKIATRPQDLLPFPPTPNPANLNELGPLVPPGPPSAAGGGGGARPPNENTGGKPADSVKIALPPEPTVIDEESFKNKLQEVLEGKQQLSTLEPFLAYRGSTQVEINGKQPYTSLTNFVNEKRGRKIKSLQFQPEKDHPKRIQTIKVALKGKGLLNLFD